jgi:hypothetical protein
MYVTLVSVVQAIALEVLVSRLYAVGLEPSLAGDSVMVWLEVALLGQTIFYVWVSYTLLVTVAQWVLRFFDFAAAFAVGIFQFAAIGWIGPDTPRNFLIMIVIGFLTGSWISRSNTGAAARRPENAEVMTGFPHRLVAGLLGVVGLLGLAGVIAGAGEPGRYPLAIALLAACNAVLFLALLTWFNWWQRVVRL